MAAGGKKSGRTIIFIAVILIIVLVAVYFVFLRGMLSPSANTVGDSGAVVIQQTTPMINIVITTQAIPRGTVISESVLTTIPFPADQYVQGTFYTDIVQVIGLRSRYDLEASVPLTPSMVVDAPMGSLASFQIPTGMTAYPLTISQNTAVAYAPQAGDHVMIIGCMLLVDLDTSFQTALPNYTANVMAPGIGEAGTSVTAGITSGGVASAEGRIEVDPTMNLPIYVLPSENNQRSRLVCQTVISDATILQVGQFPLDGSLPSTTTSDPVVTTDGTTAEEATPIPTVMTVIVTPQEAVMLDYMVNARIQLSMALRGAGDLQAINTESVTLQFLMDQRNIQLPAKLPYGLEPRIDSLQLPQ
ncbi:MAG TPA: SAF domain-containing protein [Longilinea sp.]|nr:SAF domain-containing protein [Longilinea sp.]